MSWRSWQSSCRISAKTPAYEQIMLAVSDFEKGNLRLSTVLTSMNG